jgi:formate hydrogenlyase subunit 6/NADH:ubiquinone oxidoreductase subunit I
MERELLKNARRKPATRFYPYQKDPPVEGLRGKVTWQMNRCIGCGLCPRVCPADAIELFGKGRDATITYHLDRCVFCSECVDVCPTATITTTTEYELAASSRDGMRIEYART